MSDISSPDRVGQDELSRLLLQEGRLSTGEDLPPGTDDRSRGVFGGAHMPAATHQEIFAQHSDALALA